MSLMNLFRKAGYPRAPLCNGVGRYIPQCQRIVLKFCKELPTSRGIREFIEHDVIEFAKNNPNVVVYVKPRRHRAANIIAEYLNGERKYLLANKFSREEVNKWVNLLIKESGRPETTLLQKWHTYHPSVQGAWTPFTNRDPVKNVIKFPNEKYAIPKNTEPTATDKLLEIFEKQKAEMKNSN